MEKNPLRFLRQFARKIAAIDDIPVLSICKSTSTTLYHREVRKKTCYPDWRTRELTRQKDSEQDISLQDKKEGGGSRQDKTVDVITVLMAVGYL